MQPSFILDLVLLGLFCIYLVYCQFQWIRIRQAIRKLIVDKQLLENISKQSRWIAILYTLFNTSIIIFVYTRIEVMWRVASLWVPTSWVLTASFMLWAVFILIRSSVAYPAYFVLRLRGL